MFIYPLWTILCLKTVSLFFFQGEVLIQDRPRCGEAESIKIRETAQTEQ